VADDERVGVPGHPAQLGPYADLVRRFVTGEQSAVEFESAFLARYLADETLWDQAEFDVLDRLFADVDDFVPEDRLRAEAGGLDADQLRTRAAAALPRLDELSEADGH
jgi:hypothetical protein